MLSFSHKIKNKLIYAFVVTILGVAIGAGWQSLVAYINLGSYYVVGLPAGILLGFTFGFGAEVIYYPLFLLN